MTSSISTKKYDPILDGNIRHQNFGPNCSSTELAITLKNVQGNNLYYNFYLINTGNRIQIPSTRSMIGDIPHA